MKKTRKCSQCANTAERVCQRCGDALCWKCHTKNVCTKCRVILDDKVLISEYFREKYGNRVEAMIKVIPVLLLLFVFSVTAQSGISDYKKSCFLVNDDYNIKEPIYNSTVINWPNSTKENRTEIIGYKIVPVKRNREVCNETVTIGSKDVDFILQGYNCKNTTGEVFCDSCIDGNCDGICSPNGGETCVRIKNGIAQYKNSVINWNETSKMPIVSGLK